MFCVHLKWRWIDVNLQVYLIGSQENRDDVNLNEIEIDKCL